GHLIALEQAWRSLIERPLYDASSLSGIADAVLLLRHAIATTSDRRRTLTVDVAQLHAALDEVESLIAAQPATASHWDSLWWDLEIASGTLLDIAQTFADERAEAAESEVLAWASAVHADVMSQRKEVRLLPPSPKADTTNERPDTKSVPAHEAISAAQSIPLPALGDIPAECARRIAAIDATAAASENPAVAGERVADQVAELQRCARESTALIERLTGIALQARQLFDDMDFMF